MNVRVILSNGIIFNGRQVKNYVDFDRKFQVNEVLFVPDLFIGEKTIFHKGDVIKVSKEHVIVIYPVKEKYLSRVVAHRKADNIIQGLGWEEGRGCAVGCTLENYDHWRYPIELGLPEWLAHLEDRIFAHNNLKTGADGV